MESKSVIILVSLVHIFECSNWTPAYITSDWTFSFIRKKINGTIVQHTFDAPSLAACAQQCSIRLAEYGPSLYYTPGIKTCRCNNDTDDGPEDLSADIVEYGTLRKWIGVEREEGVQNTRTTSWPLEQDCKVFWEKGYRTDGVYTIARWDDSKVEVECDMSNGGWTVIQKRVDGSVNFDRNWTEYRSGFGDSAGEHWLGLDNIHHLTTQPSMLRVYLEPVPGSNPSSMTATYTTFSVGNAQSDYALHVDGFNGDCSDSLSYHDGSPFSTYDRVNSECFGCPSVNGGGWWFKCCFRAFLNGDYLPRTILWSNCWSDDIFVGHPLISKSAMYIKRHTIADNPVVHEPLLLH